MSPDLMVQVPPLARIVDPRQRGVELPKLGCSDGQVVQGETATCKRITRA
jgi:hypothetical protein